MVNEKKIAFIVCVNNEQYFNECVWYINRLIIPENVSIDIIGIREAESMCAAYQAGMVSSDAKYKIYLHQDVMIRNSHFLEDIIKLFDENPRIGMLGMIGGTHMPKTGVSYRAWNVGVVDCRDPDMSYYLEGAKDMNQEDTIVEAVDGLLIATQYDIQWREDLFTHFDFYDVSQSFEMRKAGYNVLVPYQKIPWVIHDSGFAKLKFYDEERRKCLEEYSDFFYAENGFAFSYDKEWNELSDVLANQLQQLIARGNWREAEILIKSYRSEGRKSSALEVIGILIDIHEKELSSEEKIGFFTGCSNFQSIYEKYNTVRFLLRRMELGFEKESYAELRSAALCEEISCEALVEIVLHAVVDKAIVMQGLESIYLEAGAEKNAQKCRQIYELVCAKPLPVAYCQKK